MNDAIRRAQDLALHLKAEGDIDFSDLFDDTYPAQELAELYLAVEEWRKTAAVVAATVEAALLAALQESDQTVEVGDLIIWAGPKPPREVCVDPDGFWQAIGLYPVDRIARWFNPNQAKKGSLPPAVRDTFFEKQEQRKIEVMAAPAQVLEDARQRRRDGA